MTTVQDKTLGELRDLVDEMQKNMMHIYRCMYKAEELFQNLEKAKMSEISLDAQIHASLSDAAKFAIENSEGPLGPADLKKFLMEEVFGKPNVLPIVRNFTQEVDKLIIQLNQVKDSNNKAHVRYKEEQRRLDVNLNKRIDTLVANIRKEVDKETREKKIQMSMDVYVIQENNRDNA